MDLPPLVIANESVSLHELDLAKVQVLDCENQEIAPRFYLANQ